MAQLNNYNHLLNSSAKFLPREKRESNIYPLSQISTGDSRKHTLIVAPTGAGKN